MCVVHISLLANTMCEICDAFWTGVKLCLHILRKGSRVILVRKRHCFYPIHIIIKTRHMETKSKTVHYRKADIIDSKGAPVAENLETLFCRALKTIYDASNKTAKTTPFAFPCGAANSAEHQILFTHKNGEPYRREGCVCGSLCIGDRNVKVPLVDEVFIENDDRSESLFTEQVEPTCSHGKKRMLEQKTVIFAIKENHVALLISDMRGIQFFEDFLTTLLQDKAGVINDASIILQNVPTREATQLVREQPIRKISFKAPGFEKYDKQVELEASPGWKKSKRTKKMHFTKPTSVLSALLSWMGGGDKILESLDCEGQTSVNVSIEISLRSKEDGEEQMNAIAAHLGAVEGLNTMLHLKGGSKLSNEQLSIQGNLSFETSGGHVYKEGAYTVLAKWLVEKMTNLEV